PRRRRARDASEGRADPPLPARRGADGNGGGVDRAPPALLGRTAGRPRAVSGKHGGGRRGGIMEATAAGRVKGTRTFKASRQRVFRAWTEPELMMRWFVEGDGNMSVCDIDLREGGHYRLEGDMGGKRWRIWGSYVEVRPPEKLVYTWAWKHDPGVG